MSEEEIARLRSEIEELNILVVGINTEHQRIVVELNGWSHKVAEARFQVEELTRAKKDLNQTMEHLRGRVREKTEEMQHIKKEMKEEGQGND